MKLATLIDRINVHFGTTAGAVALRARLLREAGMISSGGRGKGGADMTAQDVAIMLLSELTIGEAKDVVFDVRRLSSIELTFSEWSAPFAVDEWADGKAQPKISGCAVPPGFEMPKTVTALEYLARLISLEAAKHHDTEVWAISMQSDQHGLSVTIEHESYVTKEMAETAFIGASGDRSDTFRFTGIEPGVIGKWDFLQQFTLYSAQGVRKEQTIKLYGELFRPIVQEALSK